MPSKVAVIVAAAGAGTRFGGPVKKTFAQIDGRPVMIRTLELFVNREDVCQIVLAVSEEDYDDVKTKYGANLGFMGVRLVKGGAERCQTVANALAAVDDQAELVAVHDAVRPCLTAEKITEVFEAAEKHGAAMLASPVNETIKRVDGEKVIQETVDRRGLYLAQTPQVFKRQVIVEAYAKLGGQKGHFTDDAQVVERIGVRTVVVENDLSNVKITRPSDLKLAEAILKAMPKPKKPGPAGPFEAEKMW